MITALQKMFWWGILVPVFTIWVIFWGAIFLIAWFGVWAVNEVWNLAEGHEAP